MMRIVALNDSCSESSNDEDIGPSLEVQEAEATRVYRKAISHLAKEEFKDAKEAFLETLNNPYVMKAQWREGSSRPKSLPQDIALKYSCYKNLGCLCMKEKMYGDASNYYLKALQLDSTEVAVWQRLGASAIKIKDFQLALIAFQEGLLVNGNHWPCIDQLLSVLFILGMYEDCLSLILQAVQKDPNYVKALAFKEKIFELQPSLIKFVKGYFKDWEILFRDVPFDKAKGDIFISTCLELRPLPTTPRTPSPILPRKITGSLDEFSWSGLSDMLIHTYDQFVDEEPNALVVKLEFDSLIKEYSEIKKQTPIKEETKGDNPLGLESGRRLCRSTSCDDDLLMNKKENDQSDNLGNDENQSSLTTEQRIPKRRHTVDELTGEDSIKRSKVELDENDFIEKVKIEDLKIIKEEDIKERPSCEENAVKSYEIIPNETQINVSENEPKNEENIPKEAQKASDEVLSQPDNWSSAKDDLSQGATNSEVESDNNATNSQNEDDNGDSEKTNDANEEIQGVFEGDGGLMSSETQAAVNQLKDIMALKPHTQILNISQAEMEYADDYFNYFDGGVYEEENEDDLEYMNMEFSHMIVPRTCKDTEEDDEKQLDITEKENVASDGKTIDVGETEKPEEQENVTSKSTQHSPSKSESKNHLTNGDNPQEKDVDKPLTDTNQATPPAPKKPKRPKRGLERELENLDYWGSRKAKEAKRRRRTLTSKLVGEYEENECLTWAHLIRSFIPATLLNSQNDSKTDKVTKNGLDKSNNKNLSVNVEQTNTKKHRQMDSEKKVVNPPLGNGTFAAAESSSTGLIESLGDNASKWNSEEKEVGVFLHSLTQNSGILNVMQRCLASLIDKSGHVWPLKRAQAYKELYDRIRKHISFGNTLSPNEDPKQLFEFAKSVLIYLELLLSMNKLESSDATTSWASGLCIEVLFRDEGLHLEDDLLDLQFLLGRPEVWNEDYLQAHLRLGLIQVQLKDIQGFPEEAAYFMRILIEQMQLATRDKNHHLEIERYRIQEDKTVYNLAYFQEKLNVLQRSQMLEKIEPKFRGGNYEEVIHILSAVLNDPEAKVDTNDSLIPSRHTQLIMLTESLVHTKDVKGIVQLGGKCLEEAIESFCASEDVVTKGKWSNAVRKILLLIAEVIWEDVTQVFQASLEHVSKLVSSLIRTLVVQLEQGASLPQPYFSTLSPWVILHLILSQHEDNQRKNALPSPTKEQGPDSKETTKAESETESPRKEECPKKIIATLAPSAMLLITAHEELGKNNWCCVEEGKFLVYMTEVLISECEKTLSDDQKLVLDQSIEQIIYCLFSHPSRKSKYKYLQDHGGQSIRLNWHIGLQLYQYYLPPQLPGFQSAQVPSITDDVAIMIRRILSLLPEEFKHNEQTRDIENYLEGKTPYSKLASLCFPEEVKDCYYLLADNYFKGKEWALAIHYYKLDVSVNSSRIDSWAPMGLAKKAQLEMLLNSCDVIRSNDELFNEAHRAIRCIDRGLHIDQYFSNLWVEKGVLVYLIHSHASRLLKQDLNPDMSLEMFESSENVKSDMLKLALECFCKASEIVEEGWDDEELPDERWLYQYMLGKLAEKAGNEPMKVLRHYVMAYKRLHDVGAKYPSKINYNSPANYSVEVLEMYYRINVFIFKYLSQREGKDVSSKHLALFKNVTEKLSESAFVQMDPKSDINVDQFTLVDEDTIVETLNGPQSNEGPVFAKHQDEPKDTSTQMDSIPSTNSDLTVDKLDNPKNQETEIRKEIVLKCVEAFSLCVVRFSHHYKSLYRLAYFYHHSPLHKDNIKARNLLFGCDSWQKLGYMPSNGLFSERKMTSMNPKNCNLFHGIWRIPNDEIDRSGSFAAHMYRCVSLSLEVLQETKDFYLVLEIALSLKHSPDKDKKYLRDNERELLCEHATQVGIQVMKDKSRHLFASPPQSTNENCRTFILDVYRAYKVLNRQLVVGDSTFSKMLTEAYAAYNGISKENQFNLFREAENFCLRNPDDSSRTTSNVSSSSNAHVSGVKADSSQPAYVHGVGRRGRPPTCSRDFGGSYRFKMTHDSNMTLGQSVAVQQAYKVYENLIHAQTVLNSKSLDEKNTQFYQKKHEEYKQQMLKYLQIPSVSQFFHSSLQNLGTSAAKLPPPPQSIDKVSKLPSPSNKPLPVTSNADVSLKKHSLSDLAAKSKVHGITISPVYKGDSSHPNPPKSNASVTVSQLKSGNSLPRQNESNTVSIKKLAQESEKSKVSQKIGANLSTQINVPPPSTPITNLTKLPSGTILSKKDEETLYFEIKPPLENQMKQSFNESLVKKNSITITKKNDPPEKHSSNSNSFQAVFQASLSKLSSGNTNIEKVTITGSSKPVPSKPEEKHTSIKDVLNEKRWEKANITISSTKSTEQNITIDLSSDKEKASGSLEKSSKNKDDFIILD